MHTRNGGRKKHISQSDNSTITLIMYSGATLWPGGTTSVVELYYLLLFCMCTSQTQALCLPTVLIKVVHVNKFTTPNYDIPRLNISMLSFHLKIMSCFYHTETLPGLEFPHNICWNAHNILMEVLWGNSWHERQVSDTTHLRVDSKQLSLLHESAHGWGAAGQHAGPLEGGHWNTRRHWTQAQLCHVNIHLCISLYY